MFSYYKYKFYANFSNWNSFNRDNLEMQWSLWGAFDVKNMLI